MGHEISTEEVVLNVIQAPPKEPEH